MRVTFFTLLLTLSAIVASKTLIAAKLYKWIDAEGVLTYSPAPPANDSSIKYEELSIEPTTITKSSSSNEAAIQKPEPDIQVTASKDTPLKKPPVDADGIRQQRNCLNLNKQIAILETQLTRAETSEQVNKTMLLIAQHQQRLEDSCLFSR